MSTQSLPHTYTIKEVSDLSGLPASTLRYYESIGIITAVARDESSKQRVYTEDDLNAITSVACLSATGMPIETMKTYLQNAVHGGAQADEQIALLRAQHDHLAHMARQLTIREQYVELKIEYWRTLKAGDIAGAEHIAAQARTLALSLQPRAGK